VRRLVVLAFVLWPLAPSAFGYPLLAPRPVPNAIAGPTDAHLAAVFYNPAALGSLRGLQVWVEGGPRIYTGQIDRAPLEGQPRGGASIGWADFDAFVGLSWDFRTDRLTLAVAAYAPFVDLSRYGEHSPVRYHEVKQRFAIVEQSIAAAFKVNERFSFGAAFNIAEALLDYAFYRDAAPAGGSAGVDQPGGLCGGAACGLENPAAAERLRLDGSGYGIGFSVGVLGRPVERLWMALSYTSRIFDTGGQAIQDDRGARVWPTAATPCFDSQANQPGTCNGSLVLNYFIPDIVHAGVRVELTPRIDLEASLRWTHYGGMAQLDVRAQGGTLGQLSARRDTALAPQFLIDRGLQDSWAVEVSGRFKVGGRLRLAPSLVFESSAVEASAVSAAAVEGPKLDAALTLEWRPVRHLVLGAHVGGTGYFLDDVSSRFSSRAEAACVDAAYSLDACRATSNGYALPSASGHYSLFVAHAGLAIGMNY
jgi:long-chain fatty acid transport protein